MYSTKIAMGRGSISTKGGQRRILKQVPDLVTYIQKSVKAGTYRTIREVEDMNKRLSENPVDIKRLRWNLNRGSNIHDYPLEYEIMSLNPPRPFKPYMPVKHQRKLMNEYNQKHRPMDRLAQKFLNRQDQQQRNEEGSGPASVEEYYNRLLGVNKVPKVDSAMGNKGAAINKAYAFAVKQYQLMRTEDLSESEALERVEELLQEEDRKERHESRQVVAELQSKGGAMLESRLEERMPKKQEGSTTNSDPNVDKKKMEDDGDHMSLLFSNDYVSYEGMISWAQRLKAVPYAQWTIGASVALDHWIAKRVLGLSEETWLALLEGDDPDLLSRGRDIVAARHALFPETIADGDDKDLQDLASGEEEDGVEDLDQLLASLGGWNKDAFSKETKGSGDESWKWKSSDEDESQMDEKVLRLTDQLQEWRAKNVETPYKDWPGDQQREFSSWLEDYVKSLAPEDSLARVDLDATRESLLASAPQTAEDTAKFWESIRDKTAAEVFLDRLLSLGPPEDATESQRIFWELPYETQLDKLVNLSTIRELVDEYTAPSDRMKFLTRYGDYLLEGVALDHLIEDSNGPITGADLGARLAKQWKVEKDDRFRIERIPYGVDSFGTEASKRARDLYRAWNAFKAGRAHYEERLFKHGKLGLRYETK